MKPFRLIATTGAALVLSAAVVGGIAAVSYNDASPSTPAPPVTGPPPDYSGVGGAGAMMPNADSGVGSSWGPQLPDSAESVGPMVAR